MGRITLASLVKKNYQLGDVRFSASSRFNGQQELQFGDSLTSRIDLKAAGISYMVKSGGLTTEVVKAFGLGRLKNIRQLTYGFWPPISENQSPKMVRTFPHTRYDHVLDAMALMALMINNNRGLFTQTEVNTGLIAALTHDLFTPAGGDAIKHVDMKGLDEDTNFGDLLSKADFNLRPLIEKCGLSVELLVKTVEGKGVLGRLLDLADKQAYCARDLAYFVEWQRQSQNKSDIIWQLAWHSVKQPSIAGIWDIIKVVGADVVATDAERMADFVQLRAMLWANLYVSPGTKFFEDFFAEIIWQYLYDEGKLTRHQLMQWGDSDLQNMLDGALGQIGASTDINFLGGPPRVKTFVDAKKADAFEMELNKNENIFVLRKDDKKRPVIKPETHYKVQTATGIFSLKEALPERAEEIYHIADIDPIRVYWVENPVMSQTLRIMYDAYKKRIKK